MSTIAFIAVIASALFHSGYNLLIKVSDEKTLYMWSIFSVAVIAGWIAGYFMVPGFLEIKPAVLLGGTLLFFSNISYRFGLEVTDVSYAAGVRQCATLFAVLMGVFLLKEPYGLFRFIAGLIIAAGIVLIKIG